MRDLPEAVDGHEKVNSRRSPRAGQYMEIDWLSVGRKIQPMGGGGHSVSKNISEEWLW